MKILMINKFLFRKGGDAICALETGALLREKGHSVTFWGMKSSKNADYPHHELFAEELDFGKRAGFFAQARIAANVLYSCESKSRLEHLIKRDGRPDIVHLHNFAHQISPSILDVFNRHKIPCVMTMHDYKLVCASYTLLSKGQVCEKCGGGKYYQCFLEGCVKGSKLKSLLNAMEMSLHHTVLHIYDHIHSFISPSLFLKKKLEGMGFKRRIVYVPNFIQAAHDEHQYHAKERSICYFGRLSPEKGIEDLIQAVRDLDVTLKIIGDGPFKQRLSDLAASRGVTNVNFLGYMTGDDLNDEIRNSLFMVIPSRCYENNPRSIIEAFALGKPVVGARMGGIPELVKDWYTGLTFTAGDIDDLRAKVELLLQSPLAVADMGQRARKFVESELNTERHYARLMDIYHSALG